MSKLNTATDLFVTYRFLRALTTPFNKTEAYKHGIIDERGTPLKKKKELKTSSEKSSYTMFDRLVFRMKRLIEKLPLGKTRLASFAAALWLIKEHTNVDVTKLEKVLCEKYDIIELHYQQLDESYNNHRVLSPGKYQIIDETILEIFDLNFENDIVYVTENNNTPYENILGCHLYCVETKNKTRLVVPYESIKRIS